MKTLYSSTFLTAILGFLLLLGQSGQGVQVASDGERPIFATIVERDEAMLSEDGRLKVEVFSSFGCPTCDVFGAGTLKTLQEKYAENKRVDFRLYLTPNMEDTGELFAVKGAHCAANFERFWDMVYALHQEEELSRRNVDLTSQGLGLPITPFRSCLDSDETLERIERDIEYKRNQNISIRPSVLVNNVLLMGPQPIENIEREIRRFLNE